MNEQDLETPSLESLKTRLLTEHRIRAVLEKIWRCHTRQHQQLMASLTDFLFMTDAQQRHLMTWGKSLTQYGLTPQSIIGKTTEEIWQMIDVSTHRHASQQALAGKDVTYEWAIPWADNIRHYQTTLSPLRNKDSETAVGLVGISRNITKQKLIEKALYFVNRPFRPHEPPFHDQVAAFLAETLPADHVIIGRLTPNKQHIETVAYWCDGQKHQTITYSLPGTPCEGVIDGRFCHYNHNVSALFPTDEMLQDLNIEAYMGQPLWDSEGTTVGLINILNRDPFEDTALLINVLQIVAIRVSHELEQQQVRQLLHIQKNLALHLSALTDVGDMATAILTELLTLEELDGGGLYLQNQERDGMVLVSHQGFSDHFAKSASFIPFSPAWVDIINNKQPVYQNSQTIQNNPDQLRQNEGLKSTANFPIFHEEEIVALLSVGSYQTNTYSSATKQVLESVSSQLGGALARATAERQLYQSQQQYQALIDAMAEGVMMQTVNGDIITFNKSAEQITGLTKEQMMGDQPIANNWYTIREDGSLFPFEEYPAVVTLRTGQPQSNVVMGIHKPNDQLIWVSINSQPMYENDSDEHTGMVTSFVDITERMTAEQKLRHSEARYHQIFETNQAIKLMIEPQNSKIVEANTAAANFYGYSHEQLLQMSITDLDVADKQFVLQRMQEALAYDHFNVTVKHRLASGAVRNVEVYAAPVNTGGQTYLYAIIHDVTRRKEVEAQLNKLSQAIEQSSTAVLITDTTGRIEYTNPRFTEMTGYTAEEALGHKPYILRSGQTPDEKHNQLWATIRNGDAWQGEFQNQRKDHSLYWESVSISPIKNEQGEITSYVITKEDITEQKHIGETLKQRNRELQLLYDASRALSATLNLDDMLSNMLTETRQRLDVMACLVWMIDEETGELVCRQIASLDDHPIQGWRLAPGQGITGRTVTSNHSTIIKNAMVDPDFVRSIGDYIGFDIHGMISVPLRINHNVIGVFQIIGKTVDCFIESDLNVARTLASAVSKAIENARLHESVQQQLTALKAAQERLLQSEKLAAIGELVAGVAHELNNPLTAVLLYSQLLERRGFSDLVKRDLQKIMTQAQRASNVVKGLLDFARQQPPEQKPTQLNDILSSTVELLSYELRSNNVQVSLDLESDLPLTLADPHQLQQVLVNLIQNAIHATAAVPEGGQLTLTTYFGASHFHNLQPSEESVLRISVSDNGNGIPEELQSRVFDPFFTTKATGIGTGLGLSVCHGIVSAHQGHIWFETKPDQGTTFFIELPVQIPTVSYESKTAQPERVLGQVKNGAVRILVIDDEATIRNIMTRILQTEGYSVDNAANGLEGLEALAAQSYDLIICDLRMPHMGGIEFYEQVAQQHPHMANRLLFATGDTVNVGTRHFFNTIQAEWLTKPFEIQAVLSKVQEKLHSLTN